MGVGYGDGISRKWREVLIAGKLVPVVNYFMDGIMVDIIEPVKEFDEAVIIVQQGDERITWGDICTCLGTYQDDQIQYFTDRVRRRYY